GQREGEDVSSARRPVQQHKLERGGWILRPKPGVAADRGPFSWSQASRSAGAAAAQLCRSAARFGLIDEWHKLKRKPFPSNDLGLQRARSTRTKSDCVHSISSGLHGKQREAG